MGCRGSGYRALEIYLEQGDEIVSLGDGFYLVPKQSEAGSCLVDYQEGWCDCQDFCQRQRSCKHLFSVTIALAKENISNRRCNVDLLKVF